MPQLPAPQVQMRIYRIPEGAEYVTATSGPEFDDTTTGANGRYTHRGALPLDFFFNRLSTQLGYELLLEAPSLRTFAATKRANAKDEWSAEIVYPPERRQEALAVKNAISPQLVNSWAVWHITTEDDDVAITESFLGGDIGGLLTIEDGPPQNALFPVVDSMDSLPTFTRRGGGGPLLAAGLSAKPDGTIVLRIEGAGWAQTLEETTHTQQIIVPNEDLALGSVGLRQIMTLLLYSNATSPLTTITDIADPDNFAGSQVVATALGETTLTQLAEDATLPTPVGTFCVIGAVTQDAVTAVNSSTRFHTDPGRHTLLQEFTRLAEQAGLLFTMPVPILIMFPPQSPTNPTQIWEPTDYYIGAETSRRPTATGFITTHSDVWRNWTYYTPDLEAAEEHGLILRNNTSQAPKPQTRETDLVVTGGAPDKMASIEALHANLQAQNAVEAIRASETQTAQVQVLWREGTRFGIDFDIGSTIQLAGGPATSEGLVVREVSMALSADGRWNFTVGLGALISVAPTLRPEYTIHSELPQTFQSRTAQY